MAGPWSKSERLNVLKWAELIMLIETDCNDGEAVDRIYHWAQKQVGKQSQETLRQTYLDCKDLIHAVV